MSATLAIFRKELKIEFRNKQMINSSLILSLMIITSFRFAFEMVDFTMAQIASPILWITFFFSGMFSLAPTYKREVDQNTKEGMLLAPISSSSIFFGKYLANLAVILAMELVSIVLFFVFFPIDYPDTLALLTIVLAGTIGFVALGNIISAISANLSQSEVMLPVLLIPLLLFTVIMSAVSGTSKLFAGEGLDSIMEEIKFILAFDVVFISLGYLLIDYVFEE
jgi:heme exporter protein B